MCKVLCSVCEEVEVRVIGEFNDEVMCHVCLAEEQAFSNQWDDSQVDSMLAQSSIVLDKFDEFVTKLAIKLDGGM